MCFSPQAANTMQGCSVFVFHDMDLFFTFPQEHTWQTKPKERTMRPTPTQPSSTLRATMHTQRKRKNTSFRLQGELCSSPRPPIFPLFQSLYLLFSLAVSPFSSPPLTTAPIMTTRNPQAQSTDREVPPSVFPVVAFRWSNFIPFTSCPLLLYPFFSFWQPVFLRQLCCCCWIGNLCHTFPSSSLT